MNNQVEGRNLKFTKLVGKHHPNIFKFEQAATGMKIAQHDATMPPPQKKWKYLFVNQHLAQFKQEYVIGERSVLRFLLAAGHLLKLQWRVIYD